MRTRESKQLMILRDDHIGDPLGLMFLDQSAEQQDAILERLGNYLGRRVKVLRVELASECAEVSVEVHAQSEAASQIASAARDLNRKGMRRGAIGLFREALELDPVNRDAAMGLGLALAEVEQYDEALSLLRLARECGPDDAELLYGLGYICLKIDRTANAIAYLERAFELDPGHFGARRALAGLGRKPKPPTLRVRQEILARGPITSSVKRDGPA
jgi:tetratricopeptide (TPR) repeat protein